MSIWRFLILWAFPVLLLGCAAVPEKKEVGEPAQQMLLAEQALEQGDLEEAARRYQQLAMAFPRSREARKALLRQGELHYIEEQYQEAAIRFEEVIQRAPLSAEGNEARLWLLRCYLKLDQFNDAVESGRSLMGFLADRAQKAQAAELVGDASVGLGKQAEALRWYARAYRMAAQGRHPILKEKAGAAVEALDKDTVVSLLTEYPEGFPNPELQTRLAALEIEKGELQAAQNRLRNLIEKEPLHPDVERWKAMVQKVQEWLQVDMRTLGCVLPLSGRYGSYADRVLRGITMAVQELASSTESSRGVSLVVRDSGGDPRLAEAAVRDLVQTHKVAAVIGPLSRLTAEAAAEQAQRLQLPIITLTQKRGVNETGSYVFRDCLSNEQQTRALAEYAVLGLGYKRFAILYPDDGYGIRLMHLFWDELERLGAEVRGVETYETFQTDFAEQIRKLVGLYYPRPEGTPVEDERGEELGTQEGEEAQEVLEEEPLPILDFEALFIPDSYEKVGLIAPQLAYYDVTGIRLLGTNLWHAPKLLEMAAPYLEGAVFVDGFFPRSHLSLTRQFIRKYEEVYGVEPGYPEAQGYQVTRLLLEALRQPGVVSRAQLRDALLGIRELPGIGGTVSVSPEGEVRREPCLISIQGRHLVELPVDFERLRKQPEAWRTVTETGASASETRQMIEE